MLTKSSLGLAEQRRMLLLLTSMGALLIVIQSDGLLDTGLPTEGGDRPQVAMST